MCIILQNQQIRKLTKVGMIIRNFVDAKLESIMQARQLAANIDQASQQLANKVLNFLSGALQLMPIELCAEIAPKVLNFTSLEDPQVKVTAYLTIEVLFASRRFQGQPGLIQISTRTLKRLLDNSEIIQNMTLEDVEVDDEGNEIR